MYACCLPKTFNIYHSIEKRGDLTKNDRSHFLSLTINPTPGSVVSFLSGFSNYLFLKADVLMRPSRLISHPLDRPWLLSLGGYSTRWWQGMGGYEKNTHAVRTIVWLSRKQWVYNHICISICLRVMHAFAYCVLLQDHCLLMCHMPKGACRLGSPRPLGISSQWRVCDRGRYSLPSLDPDVICVPKFLVQTAPEKLIFHQSLYGSWKKSSQVVTKLTEVPLL